MCVRTFYGRYGQSRTAVKVAGWWSLSSPRFCDFTSLKSHMGAETQVATCTTVFSLYRGWRLLCQSLFPDGSFLELFSEGFLKLFEKKSMIKRANAY